MIYDERLHREVDGENSPDESARLREELGRRPDLRARYDELVQLVRALDEARAAEIAPELADEVMRAVRARARRAASASTWRDLGLARRPAFGLGLSLAAGLVIGAFLAGLGDAGRWVTDGAAAGTMLGAARHRLPEVDRVVLAGDDFRAEAILYEGDGQGEVRVRVDAGAPVELTATFDGGEITPLGFDKPAGPAGEATLGPGSLRIAAAGAGEYVLRFSERTAGVAAVRVRLGRAPAMAEGNLRGRSRN